MSWGKGQSAYSCFHSRTPPVPGTSVEVKDLAILAFPLKIQHLPALGCRLFPAGFIPVVIGRAAGINTFRASQKIPARLVSIPEIGHCFTREIDQHGFKNIYALMARPKYSLFFHQLGASIFARA